MEIDFVGEKRAPGGAKMCNLQKETKNPFKCWKCLKQKVIPSHLGVVRLIKVVSDISFRHLKMVSQAHTRSEKSGPKFKSW